MPDLKKVEVGSFSESIFMTDRNVLIERIPDYYAQKKSQGFNSHIAEDDNYYVGTLVAVGNSDYTYLIGNTVFYMKNSGVQVTLEKKKFDKVSWDHVHLVRLDERIINQ